MKTGYPPKTIGRAKPKPSRKSRSVGSRTNLASTRKSAYNYLRAIQAAFKAGTYIKARALAEQGLRQYPNHPELATYARVLAPPQVLGRQAVKKNDLRANRDWLVANSDKYRGKWVALHNGVLVTAGDSLRMVREGLGQNTIAFVTKVF